MIIHVIENNGGKIELKEIMEVVIMVVEGDDGRERKIICEHPRSRWDNYFGGDQIVIYLGGNVSGDTIMFMRYRLLGNIEGKYLKNN